MKKPRCRILTDRDRDDLAPVIDFMFQELPEMMARKIPGANVQQAWMLKELLNLRPAKTLCAGCFEDTAFECLKKQAWPEVVIGIDPHTDESLSEFREKSDELFDCVFATSVLEHVDRDEEFVADMAALLKLGGTGLLTVDYRDGFKAGDPVPGGVGRLYSRDDIARIGKVLKRSGCQWIGELDYEGDSNFEHGGCRYSFMTMAFARFIPTPEETERMEKNGES